MKRVGKLWKVPLYPETRTTPSRSLERRTCATSIFLFKATWLLMPFPLLLHSTPFSSRPSSSAGSSNLCKHPHDLTTQWQSQPFHEENPSGNRTLSSLTQSVSRFWISRRKNQSDTGLALGYGSAVTFPTGPVISAPREPGCIKVSRQRSPLLVKEAFRTPNR